MTLVAPEAVIPRILTQLRSDIDAGQINAISSTDLAIWATPPGTAYVDGRCGCFDWLLAFSERYAVLASKKVDEPVKKGKGYKDAQWEAEVRKSLANKKKVAGPVTLSKQDLALVQAQLDAESAIRARVEGIRARLQRGLHYVHSVAAAHVELHAHISSIVDLLLNGAFGGTAVTLIGYTAFETYLVSTFSTLARSINLLSSRTSRTAAQSGWKPSGAR